MYAKWRLNVLTVSKETAAFAYILRVKVNKEITLTPKMEAEIFSESSITVHCRNTQKPQHRNHINDKIYFLMKLINLIV